MTLLPTAFFESEEEWYQSLVDDCKAIITEAVFNSRWELIAGHHAIGKRIVTEVNLNRKDIYGKKILSRVTESIGMRERDLYRCIQFYEMYPDLNKLPHGKNISWHKIANDLLPNGGKVTERPAYRFENDYMRLAKVPSLMAWNDDKTNRYKNWLNEGKEFFND